MIVYDTIISKRGTAEEWAAHDDVLLEGELGLLIRDFPEADVLKAGDGFTPFSLLPAVSGPIGPQGEDGPPGETESFTSVSGGSPADVVTRSGITPPIPGDLSIDGGSATSTDLGTLVDGGNSSSFDTGTAYNDGNSKA